MLLEFLQIVMAPQQVFAEGVVVVLKQRPRSFMFLKRHHREIENRGVDFSGSFGYFSWHKTSKLFTETTTKREDVAGARVVVH